MLNRWRYLKKNSYTEIKHDALNWLRKSRVSSLIKKNVHYWRYLVLRRLRIQFWSNKWFLLFSLNVKYNVFTLCYAINIPLTSFSMTIFKYNTIKLISITFFKLWILMRLFCFPDKKSTCLRIHKLFLLLILNVITYVM